MIEKTEGQKSEESGKSLKKLYGMIVRGVKRSWKKLHTPVLRSFCPLVILSVRFL